MLRLIFLFAGISLAPMTASACDMASATRPSTLAAYIENGETCLKTPPADFRFDADLEARFIDVINDDRAEKGLPALKLRESMRPAARFHSLDMGVNAFFDHDSPGARDHVKRIGAFDRTLLARGSAENLAQFGPAICLDQNQREVSCASAPGFRGPSSDLVLTDLHQKLMASEGHRKNILDPNKTHIAVGVARTESGFYVTQVFAEVAGEFLDPAPIAIEAGGALEVLAQVPGWTVSNFALSQEGEKIDFVEERVPSDLSGMAALSVRAEQFEEFTNGDVTQVMESWIYPSGPLVEIVPAKGS